MIASFNEVTRLHDGSNPDPISWAVEKFGHRQNLAEFDGSLLPFVHFRGPFHESPTIDSYKEVCKNISQATPNQVDDLASLLTAMHERLAAKLMHHSFNQIGDFTGDLSFALAHYQLQSSLLRDPTSEEWEMMDFLGLRKAIISKLTKLNTPVSHPALVLLGPVYQHQGTISAVNASIDRILSELDGDVRPLVTEGIVNQVVGYYFQLPEQTRQSQKNDFWRQLKQNWPRSEIPCEAFSMDEYHQLQRAYPRRKIPDEALPTARKIEELHLANEDLLSRRTFQDYLDGLPSEEREKLLALV